MFKRVEDWNPDTTFSTMNYDSDVNKRVYHAYYITDKIFSDDELRNMDIIHNTDVKLFEDQYEDSYTIDNFISEKEKDTLIDFYEKYKNVEVVNHHIYHIIFPLKEKVISDILRPKIHEEFGDDIYFYSDISNDPISVGDQFFKAVNLINLSYR